MQEREDEQDAAHRPRGTLKDSTRPRDTLIAALVYEALRPGDRCCEGGVQGIDYVVQLDRNLTTRILGLVLDLDLIEPVEANVEDGIEQETGKVQNRVIEAQPHHRLTPVVGEVLRPK